MRYQLIALGENVLDPASVCGVEYGLVSIQLGLETGKEVARISTCLFKLAPICIQSGFGDGSTNRAESRLAPQIVYLEFVPPRRKPTRNVSGKTSKKHQKSSRSNAFDRVELKIWLGRLTVNSSPKVF